MVNVDDSLDPGRLSLENLNSMIKDLEWEKRNCEAELERGAARTLLEIRRILAKEPERINFTIDQLFSHDSIVTAHRLESEARREFAILDMAIRMIGKYRDLRTKYPT